MVSGLTWYCEGACLAAASLYFDSVAIITGEKNRHHLFFSNQVRDSFVQKLGEKTSSISSRITSCKMDEVITDIYQMLDKALHEASSKDYKLSTYEKLYCKPQIDINYLTSASCKMQGLRLRITTHSGAIKSLDIMG